MCFLGFCIGLCVGFCFGCVFVLAKAQAMIVEYRRGH